MKYFSPSGFIFTAIFLVIQFSASSQTGIPDSDQILKQASQLHDSGYYDASIRLLSQISLADPNYSQACYEQALSYYYNGNSDQALHKCKEAEFFRFDHPYLFSLMGSILDDLGKPAEGIVILKKALKKWPYNQNLLYNLGVCYLNAGMPDSCEIILTKAVVLYPYHTRSHMGIAKANYAMGRLAESYLAFSMAVLISPNSANIGDLENAIGGKLSITPRAYLYPYPAAYNSKKWDDLRYLMQSEFAFNKAFDFPYALDFTFTRQLYLLFTNMVYDPSDTSVYNRFYVRFFHELMQKQYFETFTNYCMKNLGSFDANSWDSKNAGKIDGFIAWAQQFFDNGRVYGYYYDLEQKNTSINHFEDGKLTSIGPQEGENNIRNGNFLIVSDDGSVSEKGTYRQDLAEGKWFLYYPNGVVKQDLNFVHDSLDGIISTYFPNGSPSVVYSFSMGTKNGKIMEYYSSGDLLSQYTYKNGILDGAGEYRNHKEGFIRNYEYKNDTIAGIKNETWLNGNPKVSCSFKHGANDGFYREWYVNGKMQSLTRYANGNKTGPWSNFHYSGAISDSGVYDENGQLSGEAFSYDRSGRMISKTGEYKGDVLTGYSISYFPNGKESTKKLYQSDTLEYIESYDQQGNVLFKAGIINDSLPYKSFYEDGTIMQEGLYYNNKAAGTWKNYNAVGILIKEGQYVNGMQSGPQKNYHANGQLYQEYDCDSNYITGLFKEYYMNGHLKTTGHYVKEGPVGEWITYYPNDTIKRRTFYRNGINTGGDILYYPDGQLNLIEIYNDEGNAVRNILYNQQQQVESDWDYSYGAHHFTTYFPGGQTKLVMNISDGLKNGILEEYYPNGQLKIKLNYIYGKPHGKYIINDYKGNRQYEYNYNMGILDGEAKIYEEGKPDYFSWYENDMNQGEIKDFHYTGNLSRLLVTENDLLNGNCDHFAPDGAFMYRIRYVNGTIKAISWKNSMGEYMAEVPVTSAPAEFKISYPNGKPAARFSLDKGLFHGKQYTYYATGSLLKESVFYYGDYNGSFKEYYANGKLRSQVIYSDNERNGPFSAFHPNGVIQCTGNYMDGEKHGDWHVYNESGKETETLRYYHGTLYEIITK